MRVTRTPFVMLPVWVYDSVRDTPTVLQVYLALAARSLVERRPPKGIGWVRDATGLGRSTVYDALAALRAIGAVLDDGDDLFLPTDSSATTDQASAPADEPSAPVDRASLLEIEETPDPSSPNGDTGFDHFWTVWPTRNGKKLGKAKALAAWRRLDLDQRRAAWRGAKNYAAASNAGLAGAMDAFRWLRDRLWDEWQTPATAPKTNGARRTPEDIITDRTPGVEVVTY